MLCPTPCTGVCGASWGFELQDCPMSLVASIYKLTLQLLLTKHTNTIANEPSPAISVKYFSSYVL